VDLNFIYPITILEDPLLKAGLSFSL